MRKLLPDLEDDILESYEEHHVADALCMELYAMKPDAERSDAQMMVLIENVKHHMEEEEQDWFPKVRKGCPAPHSGRLARPLDRGQEDRPPPPGSTQR